MNTTKRTTNILVTQIFIVTFIVNYGKSARNMPRINFTKISITLVGVRDIDRNNLVANIRNPTIKII
ncbi:Uncharacterised protein [Vibrio cholerae]|uniref:Uncharacterized protein n=1 Tax=Vibrio cholerae TaxID=666 RepID=A0A655S5U1_VIBCL|nr:Uncharacterised protein [Vibrio cholerae]CSC08821.1 Uncharacterised protein [Vibrio cholerae]CSD41064.1 Uncharacterised protein [Vibrio cholerae]